MFNLTTESKTTMIKNRVANMLEMLVADSAQELHNGGLTRDVAIPALCKIVTAVLPNTGKGHAESVRSQVEQAIDTALEGMETPVLDKIVEESKTGKKAA